MSRPMSKASSSPAVLPSSRVQALRIRPILAAVLLISASSRVSAAAVPLPATSAVPSAGKPAKPGVGEKSLGPRTADNGKPAPGEMVFIPSTFVDNPKNSTIGKDIFFPDSQRLALKDNAKSEDANSSDFQKRQLLKELVLRGVSGRSNRRLALINSRTLAAGEIWDFKGSGGQTRRIKCEEIRPKSVVITIEGVVEKHELQLRDGL